MSLEYKGYIAGPIDFDDGTFSGIVAGLKDVVHFKGTTAAELERAFRDSIDDYLAMCAEAGVQPDRVYSGEIPLRPGPKLHREIAIAAQAENVSLNQWIVQRITRALEPEMRRVGVRVLKTAKRSSQKSTKA